MTRRAFGPEGSCIVGIAVERDFTTISIGFSRFSAGILMDAVWLVAVGGRSLRAAVVISAKGVPGTSDGSGLTEGSGVGRGGASSGTTELRPFFAVGATLFLLRGDGFLVGDSGSGNPGSGLNISEGSMLSLIVW